MMTDYQGPRRTRLVVYSCCRSVCILHCISFHWGLRKMGKNPIMGQHENRGESRNVSNASNHRPLVHALMSVPASVDQARQTRDDVTTRRSCSLRVDFLVILEFSIRSGFL